MEQAHTPPARLMRLREVLAQTSLGRTAVYDRVRSGQFPQPVALTKTARAWREDEVQQWIAARIAERDEGRAA